MYKRQIESLGSRGNDFGGTLYKSVKSILKSSVSFFLFGPTTVSSRVANIVILSLNHICFESIQCGIVRFRGIPVSYTHIELTQEQSSEASKFLHTIGDFERIGDHAVNIANAAQEMTAKKLVFSPAAQKDLGVISSALSKIVILTVDSFTDNDIAMAKKVEPLEQVIDDLCDEIKIRHIKRLRDGDCTLDLGFVYNDLDVYKRQVLSDTKRCSATIWFMRTIHPYCLCAPTRFL